MTKVGALFRSLKKKGLIGTGKTVLAYAIDRRFDQKYGTDTFSWVGLDDLGIEERQKQHSIMYQPTNAMAMRNVLRKLGLAPGKVLVDLGCGKGRVLLIASEFGYSEARGVEVSPVLCDIARSNCAIYKEKTGTKTTFRIIPSDVLDYNLSDDEDVFFLFNPFDDYVLQHVIQNISDSYRRRNRDIWIIYRFPAFGAIIESSKCFRKTAEYVVLGHDFAVYTNSRGLSR